MIGNKRWRVSAGQ